MNHFNPITATLHWELDAPPSDNRCHASAAGGHRYATQEYKTWVERMGPELRALLGDWQPDTNHWWHVKLEVWISGAGDAQNLWKPVLDLLSGSYVVPQAYKDERGRRISKGTVLKVGALWDDDCRVGSQSLLVRETRHATPYVVLTARPTVAPLDWKAAQKEREQAEKANAAEAERQARTRTHERWQWESVLRGCAGDRFTAVRKRIRTALKTSEADPIPVCFSAAEWAVMSWEATP